MRLALYQPDIPQNAGALLRLTACLSVPADVIEPCGFPFSDRGVRRAGMDYMPRADVTRHRDWQAFLTHPARRGGRLVLLSTRGETAYMDFAFQAGDTLLLGRESSGVPDAVHARAEARLVIPMAPGLRSLNVAMAGAIVLSESLRQIGGMSTLWAHHSTGTPPASA